MILPDGSKVTFWPGLEISPEHPRIRNGKRLEGSHCMRGWAAIWQIHEGWLWLMRSSGLWEFTGEPIPAVWVTGHIDLMHPSSPTVAPVPTPRFQKRHFVELEMGRVITYERCVWDSVDEVKRGWPPQHPPK